MRQDLFTNGLPFDGNHNVCEDCGGPIWTNPLWEPIGILNDTLGAHQLRLCPDCIQSHPAAQYMNQPASDDANQQAISSGVSW